MKYKSSLGTTAKIITAAITLLIFGTAAFVIYRIISGASAVESIVETVVLLFLLSVYALAYVYHPSSYSIEKDVVIICRPAKDLRIPIDKISDAFLVKKASMTGRERVGGNGGLFGFYGDFKNTFGMMTWYATRLKNYIMIETTDNERVVITPDNTDMVKEIRRLIGK